MKTTSTLRAEYRRLLVSIALGITGLTAYAASKFIPGKLTVIITGLGFLGFLVALVMLAVRVKTFWRMIGAVGISFLSVIVGMYVLLFAFVYFFQDTVANKTSSFFQPKTIAPEAAQALIAGNVTALDLATPDGVHLRGWLVGNSQKAKTPLLIYFGGSGSESSEMIPFAQGIEGWSVALINYRGFGLSEGLPTQSNVLADALLIYDTLAARTDVDTDQIVVMGYSLGTGVAVHLANQRPAAGTILVSPYEYWTLIRVKQTPLYAPLSGIMKHYFDSLALAPKIDTPLLCLTGSNDIFVPPAFSQRLVAAWGASVTAIEYPVEDHFLLFHSNTSWADIATFLQNLE